MPTNRLVSESSPYLQQHAQNPVDWFPWGDEAFAEARRRDCPVFVSIGYSTCHWCHVMEHESFADPDIAALMNKHLVCIKIDREERPDLDAHFMHHCQLLTGSGGWPLTVVLTPEGDVFYAGTYFPPDSIGGRIGMLDLVPRLAAAWHEDRERVQESVRGIRSSIVSSLEPQPGRTAGAAVADEARDTLAQRFDPDWGGFGPAPKFPTPQHLQLLLQGHGRPARSGDLALAERTLQEMRRGGLFDQVGHGFHRYSTDREWRVPHFEKMLYDQALLVPVCVQAWRITGRPFHRSVVEETLGFVMRELALPGGGFHSALDADTEGEEGRFHTWTRGSLAEALGTAGMAAFDRLFPLPEEGNWRGESGRERGLLVLRLPGGPGTGLEDFVHGSAVADGEAAGLQAVLREARDRRVRPFLDDKVLCDWNAMMVSALAQAGFALGRQDWLDHAAGTARFLLRELAAEGGRLLHRWRAGTAGIPAMLPDYAALVEALLELYTADGDPARLAEALRLQELQDRLFLDSEHGGYFETASDATELPLRRKEAQDGALPSGNSLALANLVRLGRLTGRERWLEQAESLAAWAHGNLPLAQGSSDRLLCGLDELRHPRRELVIQGDPESNAYRQLLAVIVRHWSPGQTLHRLVPAHRDTLVSMMPWLRDLAGVEPGTESARVLVCRNRTCDLPCTTVSDLEKSLSHP